jgi:hypothetical protein
MRKAEIATVIVDAFLVVVVVEMWSKVNRRSATVKDLQVAPDLGMTRRIL